MRLTSLLFLMLLALVAVKQAQGEIEEEIIGNLDEETVSEEANVDPGLDPEQLDMGDLGGEGMDPEMLQQMMGGMMGGEGGLPEGMDPEMLQQMMGGMGGMMGGGGIAQRQEDFANTLPKDNKYVTCDTCKALVRKTYHLVQDRRNKYKNTKLGEADINEMLEDICDSKKRLGQWMSEYTVIEPEDLEKEPKLSLKRMNAPGHCEEACWLIENTCKDIYSIIDSDLVEELWKNKLSKDDLVKLMCNEYTDELKGSCGQKYPKMPKKRVENRRDYPEWRKKSEMQLKMDEVNYNMPQGMPGLSMMG